MNPKPSTYRKRTKNGARIWERKRDNEMGVGLTLQMCYCHRELPRDGPFRLEGLEVRV